MISIAFCDDDRTYVEQTFKKKIYTVQKLIGIDIQVSFFADGNELIACYNKNKRYDIVMLDIDMPIINGKEIAEKLRLIDSGFFLVFITSYKAEIYNTLPYRINAFIPKDSDDDFYIAELARVIKEYERYQPNFEIFQILKNGEKQVLKVLINDILYFYCTNKTAFLVTYNSEFQLISKITDIANKYIKKNFFEICRGYIVNIVKVKMVKKHEVILDNDARLPLSRGRDKILLNELTEYISSRI